MGRKKWQKPLVLERWEYAKEQRDLHFTKTAAENYGLYDGTGHWLPGEINQLKNEERPITILNYIFKAINTLTGNEIQNRNDIHAFPIEGSDVNMANIINYLFKYVKKQSGLDWQFTQANMDGYITSQGWLKNTAKINRYGDWDLEVKTRSPLVMYFDPDSIELDLSDCQNVHESVWLPEDKMIKQYPKMEKEIKAFVSAKDLDMHDLYVNDQGLCRSIYSEWKEYFKKSFWRQNDGTMVYWEGNKKTGRFVYGNGQIWDVNRQGSPITGRREYKETFSKVVGQWHLGDVELEKKIDNPFGCGEDEFSFTLVAPYFSKGKGVSPVDQIKSINEIINKSYAQALDILNRQPKVGGIYEKNAIEDPDSLEEISTVGKWIEVEDMSRIEVVPPPAYPQAHMMTVKDSINLLKEILGTPEVFMGEAPGRIESGLGVQILRKQAGLSFEQPADNIRMAQIQVGRKIINQIGEFWSSKKAARIVGDDGNFTDVSISGGQIQVNQVDAKTGLTLPDENTGGLQQQTFQNKLRESHYDFTIDVNAPTVTQRMYNQMLAMQLFDKLANPALIPLLIDILDFPNKEKWTQAAMMGMQAGMQGGTQQGAAGVDPGPVDG